MRNVRLPLVGLGETRGGSAAVRPLPEDSQVSFAIRLKSRANPIWCPNRKPILAFERELSNRTAASPVVDPDVGVLSVFGADCELQLGEKRGTR